ncbi:YbaB/EbfC family nucleoid-associated protein [Saccharopolyspora sp. K220]|uniref:YbaB/EbfC family nucleoid-associated protein n=1 Tax=Saccharopolyspora soli TaxID=2926618 RepID=UPI001F57C66C|nr:YbaB/EbfC family nucleoid-associated protein [Saccharopolyspora soli]MCI2417112.1 YbaB/EbfC family nucleoid-associated protein [Saccharopolyspora soli]
MIRAGDRAAASAAEQSGGCVSEGFGADIGATERMVRQWQEQAAEKAEKFARMQEEIEQISVTESSRDGAIQVTVSSAGILQDLQLAESAGNRPMVRLSVEIMRTVQAAQAKIPELMQQAVVDTVGLDDSAAQHVVDQARRYFPEPPEDEDAPQQRGAGVQEMQFGVDDDYDQPQRRQPPNPPQQPPSRRRPDDFDDDLSGGSFLR